MWWKRARDARDDRSDAATARDERLSAYLDGDLAAGARARLEAELASDADLRDALEGMREVRAMLGSLEDARAPRSFSLPAPVVRAPSRIEWATRLGTVAAAVAFVIAAGSSGTVGTRGEEAATMSRASDSAGSAGGASEEAPREKATAAAGTTMEAARSGATAQADGVAGPAPALAPAAPVAPPPTGGFTAPGITPQPPTANVAPGEAAGQPQPMPAPLEDSVPDGRGLDREGRAVAPLTAALGVVAGTFGLLALGQLVARRRAVRRGA